MSPLEMKRKSTESKRCALYGDRCDEIRNMPPERQRCSNGVSRVGIGQSPGASECTERHRRLKKFCGQDRLRKQRAQGFHRNWLKQIELKQVSVLGRLPGGCYSSAQSASAACWTWSAATHIMNQPVCVQLSRPTSAAWRTATEQVSYYYYF